jgi:hypothetical protein
MNNTFDDIVSWNEGFEVFDEFISLLNVIIFEIVNHEVKSGFWKDVY